MKAVLLPLAIAYLQANPDMQINGAKRLAKMVNEPLCKPTTWKRARIALGLPALPPGGVGRTPRKRSRKQERKAAFALYPNTYKIVVDTEARKIIFYGEGGFKVSEKRTKKAVSASLRLFRLAQFETKEHDTETGIMILTLKPEAAQAVAA
jgi:hypothetical protein